MNDAIRLGSARYLVTTNDGGYRVFAYHPIIVGGDWQSSRPVEDPCGPSGINVSWDTAEYYKNNWLRITTTLGEGVRSWWVHPDLRNPKTKPTGEQAQSSASEPTASAEDILEEVKDTIVERGKVRDKEDGERSVKPALDAWWTLYGSRICQRGYPMESEMWFFLSLLKMARSAGGDYRRDDYTDILGYALLGVECAEQENPGGDK